MLIDLCSGVLAPWMTQVIAKVWLNLIPCALRNIQRYFCFLSVFFCPFLSLSLIFYHDCHHLIINSGLLFIIIWKPSSSVWSVLFPYHVQISLLCVVLVHSCFIIYSYLLNARCASSHQLLMTSYIMFLFGVRRFRFYCNVQSMLLFGFHRSVLGWFLSLSCWFG